MTRLLTRTLWLALLVSCSGARAQSGARAVPLHVPGGSVAGLPAAAAAPALRQISAHMAFLAADALRGRETGTVAGEITATYVASVLRGLGLTPGGDGQRFIQSYPLRRSRLDLDGLRLALGDGQPLVPLQDYALRLPGGAPVDLRGGVVFVGHGVVDQQSGLDAYAGLDVSGRFVAVLRGVPEGRDELAQRVDDRSKRAEARRRGALGLIVLSAKDDVRAARVRGWLRRSMSHDRLVLVDDESPAETTDADLPSLYPEPSLAGALFAAAGLDFEVELEQRAKAPLAPGFVLPGVQLTLRATVQADDLRAQNVAALLPGADPQLAAEVIVVSAHMDHVGVGADGAVFNGADDNASGTTTLLAVAEALARRPEPLRRSVLFLAVSGEEKGLLGSQWWVEHPTWPLVDVIADINIDMVGRNDPDSIGATPSPDHADYNTLVALAAALGPGVGLTVDWSAGEGDYRRLVDSYYRRSDHAHFAEKGIPVVFFFAGEHEDYHGPGDTLEKIDLGKIVKVSRLVERLVTAVAQADDRPQKLAVDP